MKKGYLLILLFALPLLASEPTQKGFLGVSLTMEERLHAESAEKQQSGIKIAHVQENTGAAEAGLQVGDRIVLVNGVEIYGIKDIRKALAEAKPGDAVAVKVLRAGETIHADVVLSDSSKVQIKPKRWMYLYDSKSAWMGVSTDNLTDQLAKFFQVESGLLVTRVQEDSPAEKAGIQAGDILLKIDNQELLNFKTLYHAMREYQEGDEVTVTVKRKDKIEDIQVTLGKLTDANGPLHYIHDSEFKFSTPEGKSGELLPYLHETLSGGDKQLREELEEMRRELQQLKKDLKKDGGKDRL